MRKNQCNWDITSVPKYRNNKVINEDGAVTFWVPNWVKSVNVELPDTNIKYCLQLIVKDDLGRRLFEAVRPSNMMIKYEIKVALYSEQGTQQLFVTINVFRA